MIVEPQVNLKRRSLGKCGQHVLGCTGNDRLHVQARRGKIDQLLEPLENQPQHHLGRAARLVKVHRAIHVIPGKDIPFRLGERLPVQIKPPSLTVDVQVVNQPLPIKLAVVSPGGVAVPLQIIESIGIKLARHYLHQERRKTPVCGGVIFHAPVEKRANLPGKLSERLVAREALVNLRRGIQNDLGVRAIHAGRL